MNENVEDVVNYVGTRVNPKMLNLNAQSRRAVVEILE